VLLLSSELGVSLPEAPLPQSLIAMFELLLMLTAPEFGLELPLDTLELVAVLLKVQSELL
jgi:hypothetical protein